MDSYGHVRSLTHTLPYVHVLIHKCKHSHRHTQLWYIVCGTQRQSRSIQTIIHYAFIWTKCLTVVDNDLCLSVHIIPVLHNTSEGAFKHGFFQPRARHTSPYGPCFAPPFPLLRPHSHSSSHSQCPPHSPPNHTLFPIPREAFASGENNS